MVPGKPKVDGNVQTVKYKIEVWGSGGQSTQNEPYPGGPGGYAKGVFTLKSGTTLMLALGGPAKGVGFGKQTVTKYLANGGGLSGVFFNEVKHENTIVIGGSGGGAGDNRARAGGAGGKVAGVGTYVDGRIAGTMGKGATQTAGGASGDMKGGGVRGDGGDKLQGGDSRHYGSGGGAGKFLVLNMYSKQCKLKRKSARVTSCHLAYDHNALTCLPTKFARAKALTVYSIGCIVHMARQTCVVTVVACDNVFQ